MQKQNIIIFISLLILFSCSKDILETPPRSKKDVFEYCWKSIDQKYSFFELKHIDWGAAHARFANHISESMSDEAFFDSLAVMIDLLQDGHSGIKSNFNEHKNIGFFKDRPENFDRRLILDHYAHGFGNVTGSLQHTSLENNQIAYIYYESFENQVTDADLDYILEKYKNTKGIIIDVRNNFGGAADNVFKIAKRFTNKEIKVAGSILKAGSAHNNFTKITDIYLSPAPVTYPGKVCVLTNRKTFSSGSVFTVFMRELSNVTIVGDTTGGGLGLPIGTELPNGWQIHFAGSQLISTDGKCYEMGVPPDVQVDMKKEDQNNGIDSIIEKATEIILN